MTGTTKRPSKIAKGASGEHPNVKEFQRQLEQTRVDGEPLEALNQALAEYLAEMKTPVPPPMPSEDEITPTGH